MHSTPGTQGILECMRSTYRRLSQRELDQRPVSRRTAIVCGVGAPLLALSGGAIGFRRVLPGGSEFRPPTIAAAATNLEEAIDSVIRVAWVAKGPEYRDSLEKQARSLLPPEDMKQLTLDAVSLDTLLKVFRDIRGVAEKEVKAHPELSSSDFLGMCSTPKMDFANSGPHTGEESFSFTLETTAMGWSGDRQPLNLELKLRGVAAVQNSIVQVTALAHA